MRVVTTRRLAGLVPALVLIGAGCAEEPPPRLPVQTVGGKVLKAGKPVPHVKVVLFPAADADKNPVRPSAQTELDGTFKLGTYSATDGVPQGEYTVAVVRLAGGREAVSSPVKVRIDPSTTDLPPIVLK